MSEQKIYVVMVDEGREDYQGDRVIKAYTEEIEALDHAALAQQFIENMKISPYDPCCFSEVDLSYRTYKYYVVETILSKEEPR